MYMILKEAHSGWRWIVLILAVAVVVDFAMGMFSKRAYRQLDNRLSLFYMIAIDIQLLLGLILYFFLSPVTKGFMSGNSTLSDDNTRFYALEHPLIMIIAIIFVHIGRNASKKAVPDTTKFQRGLIFFGISLIFILSRMQW